MNTTRRTAAMLAALPAIVIALRPEPDVTPLQLPGLAPRRNACAKVHTKSKHRRGRPVKNKQRRKKR